MVFVEYEECAVTATTVSLQKPVATVIARSVIFALPLFDTRSTSVLNSVNINVPVSSESQLVTQGLNPRK